jgi:ectoine hydroxylase-related dioxygenase (phytanoyl-CoA dioxygenase family)
MVRGTFQVQENWLPSHSDISRYERDGWFITPPILPAALLDEAWAGIERFLTTEKSTIDPAARVSDAQRRHGAPIDHIGYLHLEIPEVRRLVTETGLGAVAGRLAGTSGVRLFHDRLLVKPPNSDPQSAIGWHVDRAYWYTCTSETMLTAWIPFAGIHRSMGPLLAVSGSHRWPDLPMMATAHRTDMDTLWAEAVSGRKADAVPLLMSRGQVSFHHCRILHGSLPNRSGRMRAALAVHLQPADNRHRVVILPNGRQLGHTNDLICRADESGAPDYADPAVFPLLWEAE